jgi:hypothetical protein
MKFQTGQSGQSGQSSRSWMILVIQQQGNIHQKRRWWRTTTGSGSIVTDVNVGTVSNGLGGLLFMVLVMIPLLPFVQFVVGPNRFQAPIDIIRVHMQTG